jgi:hypothetical protein
MAASSVQVASVVFSSSLRCSWMEFEQVMTDITKRFPLRHAFPLAGRDPTFYRLLAAFLICATLSL